MYIYAKMKTIKNEKYLYTVIYCYSHVPSCKSGLNGGLNSVFRRILTKSYSKIKTGFISPLDF